MLIAGCIILSACKEEPPEAVIEIDPVSQIVNSTEGTTTFKLTCNYVWSISNSDSWILEISPDSGNEGVEDQTITVKYDANVGDVRSAELLITCLDKTAKVTLSQSSALAAPQLGKAYLMKLTLQEDPAGFNMLTNGGFEDNPDEAINYLSNWWVEESTATLDAHSGSRAVKPNSAADGFHNICIQDIPVIKDVEYTQTAWLKSSDADPSTIIFVGTRKGIEGEPILKDQGFPFTTSWAQASLDFTPTDVTKAVAFVGFFGINNIYPTVDDVVIKPKGVEQKSYMKASIGLVGSILDNYGNDLISADGITMWDAGSNKIMMAFGENMQAGAMTARATAVATSTDNSLSDGFVSSLVKSGDKVVVPLTPAGGDEIACLPTGGFSFGTRQYMHYMSVKTKAFGDDAWTANKSSLAYSDDNGVTWIKSNLTWTGTGNFVQASFVVKDGYVYMYGTQAGRSESPTKGRKICVARVASSNILTQNAWEYWNGKNWTTGDENSATSIASGLAGEITVLYNSTHNRYMMLYYSPMRQAIVYRDARAPQGEWSGEKLIFIDSESGLYGVSFHPVSDGNDIYFIVSSAWGLV